MIIHQNVNNADYTFLIPSEPISNYIDYIVDIKGCNPDKGDVRLMPEIKMDLAFNLGSNSELILEGKNSFTHKNTYISGVIPGYCDYKTKYNYHICNVILKPEMQYSLFGFLTKEITGKFIETDLCIKSCNEVWYKLMETFEANQRLQIINKWLFNIILNSKHKPNQLSKHIRNTIDTNLDTSILSLEKELNFSRKHIFTSFKDSYGISIKTYKEILRFKAAMNKIQESNFNKLIDIVHPLGYFDQSHFIRSFKKYSGFTPKQYAKNCDNQFVNVYH